MPYPEYATWKTFYLLEPWGYEVVEEKIAQIISMLYNVNRAKGRAKAPKDFMIDRLKELTASLLKPDVYQEPTHSREELLAMIRKDFGIR
jgi:hypothetical protein